LNVNFPKPLRASRVGARALLLLVAVQGISACASGPRPENTVTRFLHAFNDKDMNVMLTCVDPRQERLFRGTFHLIERFTGFPVEDVLDVVPGLAQLVPQQQMDDVRFSDVRFVDRRVEAGEAEVTVSMTVEERRHGISSSTPATVRFSLQYFEEDGWRIVGADAP